MSRQCWKAAEVAPIIRKLGKEHLVQVRRAKAIISKAKIAFSHPTFILFRPLYSFPAKLNLDCSGKCTFSPPPKLFVCLYRVRTSPWGRGYSKGLFQGLPSPKWSAYLGNPLITYVYSVSWVTTRLRKKNVDKVLHSWNLRKKFPERTKNILPVNSLHCFHYWPFFYYARKWLEKQKRAAFSADFCGFWDEDPSFYPPTWGQKLSYDTKKKWSSQPIKLLLITACFIW